MSHFSVMVITATKPGDEELARILQPWHEYECTGVDDEYVVEVDVTDNVKSGMADELKEGMSFEDAASGWCGGHVRDGRAYRRTNPNKKWDWWQIGGRWSDLLPGAQCRRGDLPLAELRAEKERRTLAIYDKWSVIVAGRQLPDWAKLREELGIEKAREAFGEHPVVKDLREAGWSSWDYELENLAQPREAIAAGARADAAATYAVVKDGKWYQRGEMGWWGMSRDEMDKGEWRTQIAKFLDEMDPDHWITIVDCHI